MPLTPGTILGVYQVIGSLGAGGMGEVYRARDTKLNRDVALKVLPTQFVERRRAVARFDREAQVLASLNHPNIAAIYGIEEAEHALVMELVEATDLADASRAGRCRSARRSDREADRRRARSRARAGHHPSRSETGQHQARADGSVKVLDFGLAKALGRTRRLAAPIRPTRRRSRRRPPQMGVISAPPPTWRRSRRAARRSTAAPTSGHSASCCTRC